MSRDKAIDLIERMRHATVRRPSISPAESIGPDARRPPGELAPLAEAELPPVRRVRYTLELVKGQHSFLKRFALDAEADGSEVVRALLVLLERDVELGERVRSILPKPRRDPLDARQWAE